MSLLDAIRLPYGVPHSITTTAFGQKQRERCSVASIARPEVPSCTRTGESFVLKDGWNYLCAACGATVSAHEDPRRSCPLTSPVANKTHENR